MSKEIKKADNQQEKEAKINAVELDDDDLDEAVGGVSEIQEKKKIEMPKIKM